MRTILSSPALQKQAGNQIAFIRQSLQQALYEEGSVAYNGNADLRSFLGNKETAPGRERK